MRRAEVFLDSTLGALEGRVRAAIGHNAFVVGDVEALANSDVSALGDLRLILVRGPSDREQHTAALSRQLRNRWEHVGIFVVALREGRVVRLQQVLARAGVDAVLELDVAGDEMALAEDVRSWLGSPVNATAVANVASRAAESLRLASAASWCLRNGDRHHTVFEVAALFDWDRKTLYRDSRRLLGVGFADLLSRGRYLRAEALHATGFSYQQIAERLKYATPSAVEYVLKRGRARCPSD